MKRLDARQRGRVAIIFAGPLLLGVALIGLGLTSMRQSPEPPPQAVSTSVLGAAEELLGQMLRHLPRSLPVHPELRPW